MGKNQSQVHKKKVLESITDRLKEVTVNRGFQTWYFEEICGMRD